MLISKSSIFGFGLNFQHCARMAFVSVTHSYERFYQALRRCWRFGQTRPVVAYVVAADTESAVVASLERKAAAADAMFTRLVEHMREGLTVARSSHGAIDATVPPWLAPVRAAGGAL